MAVCAITFEAPAETLSRFFVEVGFRAGIAARPKTMSCGWVHSFSCAATTPTDDTYNSP